ncbi:MAG: cation transporter [Proteobacteria bacterium]|nr:cation transporter [Pseudomonadota bacterium]
MPTGGVPLCLHCGDMGVWEHIAFRFPVASRAAVDQHREWCDVDARLLPRKGWRQMQTHATPTRTVAGFGWLMIAFWPWRAGVSLAMQATLVKPVSLAMLSSLATTGSVFGDASQKLWRRRSVWLVAVGNWLAVCTYFESADEIPEPHAFTAHIRRGEVDHEVPFEEHEHGHHHAHRDNNMRAAVIHVAADAAVSVLVIVGLLLARAFGWLWMDPLAGIAGACVIASWSCGLIRDTGAILLDITPDRALADGLRRVIEQGGDRLADLHLWRVGPGHLAAILSVVTTHGRGADYYRGQLGRFKALSHVTIEVCPSD